MSLNGRNSSSLASLFWLSTTRAVEPACGGQGRPLGDLDLCFATDYMRQAAHASFVSGTSLTCTLTTFQTIVPAHGYTSSTGATTTTHARGGGARRGDGRGASRGEHNGCQALV